MFRIRIRGTFRSQDPNPLLFVRILQTAGKKIKNNFDFYSVAAFNNLPYILILMFSNQQVKSEKSKSLFVIGKPLKKRVGSDEWFGSADLDPDPYRSFKKFCRITSFNVA